MIWKPADGIMQYAEIRLRDVESGKIDISKKYKDFLYSEKFDGWFVVWDGAGKLYTKSGKLTLPAPPSFLKQLPKGTAISGELVVKGQQATSVAGLRTSEGPWNAAKIFAFDLPANRTDPFRVRTEKLRKLIARNASKTPSKRPSVLRYIPQFKVTTNKAFLDHFYNIVGCTGKYKTKNGAPCFGEGVVLTDPASLYLPRRVSSSIRAKLKRREDSEALVVGHGPSSLLVRFKGKTFRLGIGFTKEQRENLKELFPVNSTVKFSFRSLGKNGIPKEARFVGKRFKEDMLLRKTKKRGTKTGTKTTTGSPG